MADTDTLAFSFLPFFLLLVGSVLFLSEEYKENLGSGVGVRERERSLCGSVSSVGTTSILLDSGVVALCLLLLGDCGLGEEELEIGRLMMGEGLGLAARGESKPESFEDRLLSCANDEAKEVTL